MTYLKAYLRYRTKRAHYLSVRTVYLLSLYRRTSTIKNQHNNVSQHLGVHPCDTINNYMPAEDPETIYLNKYMKVEWRCKYCSHSYATNGGNHAIKKHLLTKHGKTEKSSRENIIAKRQRSIKHALELSENQSFKRRKLTTYGSTGQSISGSHLEVLYIKFITACHLPLRLVECPEFRDLLNYINNDIDTWLPTSHTTITDWVLRQFSTMKENMKSRL